MSFKNIGYLTILLNFVKFIPDDKIDHSTIIQDLLASNVYEPFFFFMRGLQHQINVIYFDVLACSTRASKLGKGSWRGAGQAKIKNCH